MESAIIDNENKDQDHGNSSKVRTDLLEYMTRNDGSVLCKLCGEILQSRTHWYRHKYKAHAMPPLNPAPLFQCEQCLVFFKSRKGYIGHLASRHSEVLADSSPVLTNSQAEALAKQAQTQTEESDNQENQADWEERRTREEKLVADIIDRVRRECEAQGSGGPARRGYTRRTTVMHT
ncbi:hypothetical protein RR48_10895 [Papilio machaon]|uniref:C2H2-type domain-containing protein n=1 Tax=Papilio machaon TaxID=76193 RepID=A0A194RCS7_PAPMA|nr:hypothetical protein RR48_10895 [Papilio machaon]